MERKPKYLQSQAVRRKAAVLVGEAMQDLLRPIQALVLILTCDNGKESAGYRQTASVLDTDIFLARRYRFCERSFNEHTNDLLHQFVPQIENLRTTDPQRLQQATDRLNHCPRKVLGYRPAYEVVRSDSLVASIAPPPRTSILIDQDLARPLPDMLPIFCQAGIARQRPKGPGRP